MVCPNCNNEIQDSSTFCKHCGMNLQTMEQNIAENYIERKEYEANDKKKRKKGCLIVVIVVLVLYIALILFGTFGGHIMDFVSDIIHSLNVNVEAVSAKENFVGNWEIEMTVTNASKEVEKLAKEVNKDYYGRPHFYTDLRCDEDGNIELYNDWSSLNLNYQAPVNVEYNSSKIYIEGDIDALWDMAWADKADLFEVSSVRFDGEVFRETNKNSQQNSDDDLITVEGTGSFESQYGTVEFEFLMKQDLLAGKEKQEVMRWGVTDIE